jgi:S-DNA-T family DNA segregation ATPase FtsK/SpoIIIE
MEYEFVVVDREARRHPLVAVVEDGATVGDLRGAILAALPGLSYGTAAAVYLGGEQLAGHRPLAETVLCTGSTLSFGVPVEGSSSLAGPAPAVTSGREVAVVCGLAAGASVPLPAGSGDGVVLGRATGSNLVLDDPEVSRRHAEIRAGDAGPAVIADERSRNGTGLRGYRLTGEAELADGDVAQLGETLVSVRRPAAADAVLEPEPPEGISRYNRPPRIVPPRRRPQVEMPAAPDKPHGVHFPLATVLLPLALGGVLYWLMPDSKFYLIFLAFSPVMAVAHLITERRSGRKEYKEKLRRYEADISLARARIAELAVAEERGTREAAPDPAALVRIATGPTSRLFERRPADDDFGHLRVGLADQPADLRLTGPGASSEQVPTVYAVPVVVDLVAAGVLGVAGPRRVLLPVARALLCQAATLHAPHDLGIVLLTGSDEAGDWEWASWLPHTLPHRAEQPSRRMVATDRDQVEARIGELRRIMDERRAEQRAGLNDRPVGRRLVVLVDGARRLRAVPGLAELLTDGPGLGVYAVCLDAEVANLPDECRATVVVTGGSGSRVRVSRPGRDAVPDVLVDGLPSRLAERISVALAPIRVLGARLGDDGDLPDRVRLLDLAELGRAPSPDDVIARWAATPGGRSTEMLLGVEASGPITVDLRRDGPHALVAGTTGAGKSELLQTLVASLALGNAPDGLNLVLVDYKGGSAFAACRDLPHCVGMVTDLDGHLANRALASLSAELRRREAILAEAGAKDIEDYWARTGGRLPRLVIVIDEFATLVEEVPDFVTGVVGIGMRGRSLGVHLVLATQRPGGVVGAEIRANVNLRVCLRVAHAEESSDVIDVPDAARISRRRPGRAYLRTGHSDLALLQCARVGWPRHTVPVLSTVDPVRVVPRRLIDLGLPHLPTTPEPVDGHDGDTDLTVLVDAIRAAARQTEICAPPSPWLPPLPELVTAAEMDAGDLDSPVAVSLGLADQPARQAQVPFVLDLEKTGPVAIAGMARSGRSTALRTLAAALAARSSPADVHLYALDYGSRSLAPLAALPHCGACVDGEEPDRVERLLDLLTAEVTRRGRLFTAGQYASLREQRAAVAPARRLPYLVLLVDRYETFRDRYEEVDGGQLVETLDALLRRGPAVGIVPVVATDRTGFTRKLSSATATRLVLRQADPDDAAVFGADPRAMPRSMPAGRAVAVPSGVEVQVALLAPDPEGAAQASAVEDLARDLAVRWDGMPRELMPHRVDPLPQSITAGDVAALRAGRPPSAPTVCTVGAGGDHIAPVDVDLADTATFLVSGPPGSGRSTALAAIVTSLCGRVDGQISVLLCCPRPSPLAHLADLPGVGSVLDGSSLETHLSTTVDRLAGSSAIVVDDAELLAEGPAGDALERIVRAARDDGTLVVAAGTTEDLAMQRYRGWLHGMRRGRAGLLLNPSSYIDGEVLDIKLPRSTCGGWPPGRGLLVRRGVAVAVQVPRLAATDVPGMGQGHDGNDEI